MRRLASEVIRNLERRIARLERRASATARKSASTAKIANVDISVVKRYFRDLEDFKYRGEDGYETLGRGGFKVLAEDILKAAQENEGDFDGFMEAISDLGDFYFSTRSYGPDHNAQDKLYNLAEDFADFHMG